MALSLRTDSFKASLDSPSNLRVIDILRADCKFGLQSRVCKFDSGFDINVQFDGIVHLSKKLAQMLNDVGPGQAGLVLVRPILDVDLSKSC